MVLQTEIGTVAAQSLSQTKRKYIKEHWSDDVCWKIGINLLENQLIILKCSEATLQMIQLKRGKTSSYRK